MTNQKITVKGKYHATATEKKLIKAGIEAFGLSVGAQWKNKTSSVLNRKVVEKSLAYATVA